MTFLGLCILAIRVAAQQPPPSEIGTLRQLFALEPKLARNALAVRLNGVVVCYDAEWNQLYVYDGVETSYFDPKKFRFSPNLGNPSKSQEKPQRWVVNPS